MTGQPAIAGRAHRDADLLDGPGSQRLRRGVRPSVRQVEHPGTYQRHRAIRRDVRESNGQRRDRRIDLQVDHDLRHAKHRQRLQQRGRGVRRARVLVASQVTGEAVGCRSGAPRQRAACSRRRSVAEGVRAGGGVIVQGAGTERPGPHRRGGVRVRRRRPPAAGQSRREWLGRRVFAFEPDDGRLLVPTVRLAPQVSIEKAGDLMELIQVGAGRRRVRPAVVPRSDQGV